MCFLAEKPEFKQSRATVFAVEGQTARIRCEVVASVPAVNNFQFMRDGRLLRTSSEYRVDSFPGRGLAQLTVVEVGEESLGRYECIANNGMLNNEAVFELVAASECAVWVF